MAHSFERPTGLLISNPSSDRVKEISKLAGRSARLRTRYFLAEGPQSVREAVVAHRDFLMKGKQPIIRDLYVTAESARRHPQIVEDANRLNVIVREATSDVMAAMCDAVTPQGMLAVCRFVDVELSTLADRRPRLIAILSQVRDPGNAGTVLRSADAAGADAVILTGSSVDIYNPKTVRAAAGSLFHLPIVLDAELRELSRTLRSWGFGILAADGYGELSVDDLQDASARRNFGVAGTAAQLEAADDGYQLESATAWIFGNEAHGLSEEDRALADHAVAVPLYGEAESLNLATAAALCLYASAHAQHR